MKPSRRHALCAMLALAAAASGASSAQTFPAKPLLLIVPASPGTALDVTARYVGSAMSKTLGQPVVVENRVGANGIIATNFVAKAEPDGHTILITAAPHFTNKWVSSTPLPFDPVDDFVPIARLANSPLMFVVAADSPYKTLADLVADMKARPGEVTYASAGQGSSTHLCTVLLNDMTGTKARHIPYKGAATAVADVVGKQVAFSCQSTSSTTALIQGGRLRALAVGGTDRLDGLKDIPTVAEAGVPGYDVSSFLGLMAPKGTPDAVVKRLSEEAVAIASSKDFQAFCAAQSFTVDVADAPTFRSQIPKEARLWERLSKLSQVE